MNVIFDLDGTLVDSAPGVLSALSHVIKKHQIRSPIKLSAELIGPPLRELLIRLSGSSDRESLILMEQTFKAYYDKTGVFKSTKYDGINHMLDDLKASGNKLFIATNKRSAPTGSLIKYFLWEQYFLGVYSLDSFEFPVKDKSSLLEKIINLHLLSKNETVYIGDRAEDSDAAKKCNLNFMHAGWGYGGNIDNSMSPVLRFPNNIKNYLN
jgi:phosphoglycolate phosphatase